MSNPEVATTTNPPHANPEAAQVSPDRLARAVRVLQTGVETGAMPGATVCAFRRGQLFLHEALGTLDGSRPTALNSIYDLASITKPMATASSILTLVESGKLLLGAPVVDSLGDKPGRATEQLAKITIFHLLTHTSGLPAWTACYKEGLGQEAALDAIAKVPVNLTPRYEYSCLNFILLAHVVQTVSGQPLDVFARENIFEPLGLHDTGYKPAPELHDRIAPTTAHEGAENEPTVLTGVVHDGNARGIGGVSGNAGLFGTAYDVARFGEALRNPTPHHRLFGQPTNARALQSQIKPEIGGHSLLFFAYPNGLCPVGDLLSNQAVGHSGFTGTVLTIDPTYDLTVAVLTNSVYGEGKANWLHIRRKFLNALAASLE